MEWQLYLLAAGLVTLQSVLSPCCQPPRLASRCLTVLESVSSPYSQYRHLAIGRLEICLTALQSAPSPCSRSRHLAVGPITLQLLILSLITRHTAIQAETDDPLEPSVSAPINFSSSELNLLNCSAQWLEQSVLIEGLWIRVPTSASTQYLFLWHHKCVYPAETM